MARCNINVCLVWSECIVWKPSICQFHKATKIIKTSRCIFPLIRDGTKRIPGENEHQQSSCFSSCWEVSSDFFKRSGTSGKSCSERSDWFCTRWPVKYQLYIGPAAAKMMQFESLSADTLAWPPLGSNVRWKHAMEIGGPEATICRFRAAGTSHHAMLEKNYRWVLFTLTQCIY